MTLEAPQPKPSTENRESATVPRHPQTEGREVAALARQPSECLAPAEATQTTTGVHLCCKPAEEA